MSPKGVTRFWSGIIEEKKGKERARPIARLKGARSLRQVGHLEVDEFPCVAMRLLGFGMQSDLSAIIGDLRLHAREFHVVDIGRDRIAFGGHAQDVLVAGLRLDAVRLAVVDDRYPPPLEATHDGGGPAGRDRESVIVVVVLSPE